MEQIQENLYRISVPLPNNPLRELNAYLLRGERDLLIDTGFDLDICEQALLEAFASLGVRKDNLDICITHFHSDHVGLLHRLVGPKTSVYCGRIPWEIFGGVKMDGGWQEKSARLKSFGLECIDQEWNPKKQPEFGISWTNVQNFKVLKDGDTIQDGGFKLQCVETDGHFSGHICLYEPEKKMLFSGDHVLDKISPNVACYNLENVSSLSQFLRSLDKVAKMDIDLVLPGHRNTFTDVNRRIEELKAHHRERLEEVERIANKEGQTGAEIASQMKWKLSYSSWEEFPITQKYFALSEALAHLNYLMERGTVKYEIRNGVFYFSKG